MPRNLFSAMALLNASFSDAHAVVEQVLEADEERRLEALLADRGLDDVEDGDLLPALLERARR